MISSLTFRSLAHTSRLEILIAVANAHPSPVAVMYLSKSLKKPMHHVSKHLSVLERAGFVSKTSFAQWVGVRLKTDKIVEMIEFLETLRKE